MFVLVFEMTAFEKDKLKTHIAPSTTSLLKDIETTLDSNSYLFDMMPIYRKVSLTVFCRCDCDLW